MPDTVEGGGAKLLSLEVDVTFQFVSPNREKQSLELFHYGCDLIHMPSQSSSKKGTVFSYNVSSQKFSMIPPFSQCEDQIEPGLCKELGSKGSIYFILFN